eukprot:2750320-Pyramimonas_sp.AAC.1
MMMTMMMIRMMMMVMMMLTMSSSFALTGRRLDRATTTPRKMCVYVYILSLIHISEPTRPEPI